MKRHDLTNLRDETPKFKNSINIENENENNNLENSTEFKHKRKFNLTKSVDKNAYTQILENKVKFKVKSELDSYQKKINDNIKKSHEDNIQKMTLSSKRDSRDKSNGKKARSCSPSKQISNTNTRKTLAFGLE